MNTLDAPMYTNDVVSTNDRQSLWFHIVRIHIDLNTSLVTPPQKHIPHPDTT